MAAARGHEVELHEADRRVGGQVLLAERLPGRAEFGGAITNLEGEARRSGAPRPGGVAGGRRGRGRRGPGRGGTRTGARPRGAKLELIDDPVVLDAWEVIRGSEVPRGRIVVADWRGDWIGIGVALRLAGQGRKVTLCVTGFAAGEHLQQYVRSALLGQAVRARVDIVPNVRLYGADSDTVYLQHTLTEEPVLLDGVAAVVLAQGHVPVSEVDPVAAGIAAGQVFAIGDCVTPRTVEEAVLEGLTVSAGL
ncbi:hypothetical protein [Streptomyces sp. NBC_01180]|uniref:hypothetical protein n=1 Tax=Streptomyces sp. NBC_01180 TaxID=2903763 RepID=UPI0038631AB5|nr:hypothetical protein OG708_34315 [Streptomyces sp. NBC_01180]